MIWIVVVALTLAVVGLIVVPVLRTRGEAADRADFDIAVYRDQLREVEADVERGLLTTRQAEAARTEIKRRMLAAADRKGQGRTPETGGSSRVVVAGAMAVAVSLGAVALYGVLGNPGLPDVPFAGRTDTDAMTAADITEMVDKLAARLQEQPEDRDGWIMLARSARALQRYDQAAEAYRRLIGLGMRDADTLSSYGETLLYQHQGFTPQAVVAFQDAVRADPKDVRARFYLGMARMEDGDAKGALAIWRDIERDAPADAEWLPGVRERIAEAAGAAGVEASSVAPQAPVLPPAGSTPPAAGSAPTGSATTSASDTETMIQGMIDRLAARLQDNPDDAEGWKRLGRAYRVQNKLELAKQAYGKAIALQPQDADLKLAYADVLLAMAPADVQAMPEDVIRVLKEVEALQPGNPDALYYLGLAAASSGNKGEARGYWTRLLEQLPEGSQERAGVQRQIDGLGDS